MFDNNYIFFPNQNTVQLALFKPHQSLVDQNTPKS
jgi:hypothetical protein